MRRKPLFVAHCARTVVHIASPRGSKQHLRRKSHLLRLPLELQRLIYAFVVGETRSVELWRVRLPGLALVSRHLFHETVDAIFRDATMKLEVLLELPLEARRARKK